MTAPLPKLVFISNLAAPYQVKFCQALQRHFRSQFWFYEGAGAQRPAWGQIPLGDNCHILERVVRGRGIRYWARDLRRELDAFSPDIVMIGGLSIFSNYVAYRWAKRHGKKVIAFSELSRDRVGNARGLSGVWRALRHLYRGLDGILTSSPEAAAQFATTFGFGDRVMEARYPADIGEHMTMPLHELDPKRWRLLFANRLISSYNPLAAIAAFGSLAPRYPGGHLALNREGPLLEACQLEITRLGLGDRVTFLDRIAAWDDLPKVYAAADILVLPAHFSGGNLTIVEAMAAGMGIVVSEQVQGFGKLVRDGQNGFVCTPTAESLTAAIERYLTRPALLRLHGERNRAIAREFTLEATAALFDRLIGERVLPGLTLSGNPQ